MMIVPSFQALKPASHPSCPIVQCAKRWLIPIELDLIMRKPQLWEDGSRLSDYVTLQIGKEES